MFTFKLMVCFVFHVVICRKFNTVNILNWRSALITIRPGAHRPIPRCNKKPTLISIVTASAIPLLLID